MNLIIRDSLRQIIASLNFIPDSFPQTGFGPYDWFSRGSLVTIVLVAAASIICLLALTFVLVPVRFKRIQVRIFSVPFLGITLLGILMLDKSLSIVDGFVLLLGCSLSVVCLLQQQKEWLNITSEVRHIAVLNSSNRLTRWQSVFYFAFSSVVIASAGEILVKGDSVIISRIEFSNGIFGLTLSAFLILLREFTTRRSAYFRNRILITPANVAGFIMAFFLFDAAVLALWHNPGPDIKFLFLYLPLTFVLAAILCSLLLRQWFCRLACGSLIAMYCGYVLAAYFTNSYF
jgi:Ca2+/Na+ antiporter